MRHHRLPSTLAASVVALALAAGAAACGDDDDGDTGSEDRAETVTVRMLTHDSFVVSDEVLEAFTDRTGIEVELLQGGDTGTVVNQAILTKGAPQADVLFGIDSTLLTRGLDEDLFVPYESPELVNVDPRFVLDPEHRVTPVDYGDVCINYDKAWFAERGIPVPQSLEELVDPRYRDLLVVEDAASSSPGLAFLLATIAHFGEAGWQGWWADLRENGVQVVDSWEDAYNAAFSGGAASQGTRPLVVSYASSPPVEVVYADPPVTDPPTGVIEAGCYRQVELAGILRGTDHEREARQVIDFLLSEPFQADVPLSMFVFPVREGTPLPDVFERFAARPADVVEVDPFALGERRDDLLRRWRDVVVG